MQSTLGPLLLQHSDRQMVSLRENCDALATKVGQLIEEKIAQVIATDYPSDAGLSSESAACVRAHRVKAENSQVSKKRGRVRFEEAQISTQREMSCELFLKTAALVKHRLPHIPEKRVNLAICDIEGVPGSHGYEKARLEILRMQCETSGAEPDDLDVQIENDFTQDFVQPMFPDDQYDGDADDALIEAFVRSMYPDYGADE
eukprot:2587366-Karenia_brevis.AAC.1